MKKLLVFFLIMCTNGLAQDYLGSYKSEVIETYNRKLDQQKNDTNFQISILNSPKNINVRITGNDDLKIKYYFHPLPALDDSLVCDSIYIELGCAKCIDHNINNILSNRSKKWKMISDGYYVSKRWTSKSSPEDGETTVVFSVMHTTRKNDAATLIICYEEMEIKKWRKL